MRVGLDIGKAVTGGDGVGRFGEQLLRALVDLDGDEEYLLVDLGRTVTAEAFEHRFPGLPARFRFCETPPAELELDVFHALTWRWPAGVRAPVLFELYDVTFLSLPRHHTPANRVSCLEGTLRALLADATFLTISEAAAAEIRSWLGPPEKRLRVVPLAAAPDLGPLPAPEAESFVRERWGLAPGYVLSVGTLEPRKNHRTLLAAHRLLPARVREAAPLVLAGGRGWLAEDLDREPDLRWLGRVTDDELRALYSAAGLLAYPSLEEGFGLPVLEAMACGAPVVTSNRSSLPEVAGDAAILVDPESPAALAAALGEILDDPHRRADLVRRGAERAATFTWRRTAEETRAIYRELAGDGR